MEFEQIAYLLPLNDLAKENRLNALYEEHTNEWHNKTLTMITSKNRSHNPLGFVMVVILKPYFWLKNR